MDYHPLATDEYSVSQSLDHEPEFKWWVTFVLKNCVGIIPLVKQRSAGYLKRKKRYGIIPPRTVEEAQIIDKANVNTLWSYAIAK